MNAIVTQMIILFILVVVGYVISKKKMMDAEFDRKLSVFVINIACPSLILSSVMGDTLPDKHLILPLLIVGFATYVILIGAGFLLPRYLPVKVSDRGIYSFMLAFGNVGFIGYRGFHFRSQRGLLCQHPQFSQHPADICFRYTFHFGRPGKDEIQMGNAVLPCHDSLLPFHLDSGNRMGSTQSNQYAVHSAGQHDRSFCPAHHRFFHRTNTYPAYAGHFQHLYYGSFTPVYCSSFHPVFVAVMPG